MKIKQGLKVKWYFTATKNKKYVVGVISKITVRFIWVKYSAGKSIRTLLLDKKDRTTFKNLRYIKE